MASQPYTDTTIIDCNRNCSLENESGNDTNPALFTNKQGTGLKLNAGDKVSIHSAYINEIGNTDGTIEFKGNSLKNTKGEDITYKLSSTEKTFLHQQPLDNTWSKNDELPWNTLTGPKPTAISRMNWGKPTGYSEKQILQPYGYKQCVSVNTEKTFPMKDNEMNVQVSYYKTADGENCFHLPRRYDTAQGQELKNYKGFTAYPQLRLLSSRIDAEDATLVWAYRGMQGNQGLGDPADTLGKDEEYVKFDCGGMGAVLQTPREESMCSADWRFNNTGAEKSYFDLALMGTALQKSAAMVHNPSARADGTGGECNTLNGLGTDARYMQKHDNSRYKIFIKENTYFAPAPTFTQFLTDAQEGDVIKPANIDAYKGNDFLDYRVGALPNDAQDMGVEYWNVRDPACTNNWVPYEEIKNIKVPVGYSAPEDIAETISQQLNKTEKAEGIFARVGMKTAALPNVQPSDSALNVNVGVNHVQVGIKKDGELYKQFYATNHGHFNIDNAKNYFVDSADGTDGNAPETTGKAARYMSAYHYLAVKRPSLFTAGRNLYKDLVKPQDSATGDRGYKTWGEIAEYHLSGSYHNATTESEGRYGTPITMENRTYSLIATTIPWSKRHLLKDLFIAQGENPELFNYRHTNIKDDTTPPVEDPPLPDLPVPSKTFANADISADTFQMGNSKTGETYARYLHFDTIKDDSNVWRKWGANAGMKHHDGRRLGSDNYRFCNATDPTFKGTFTAVPATGEVAAQQTETQNGFLTTSIPEELIGHIGANGQSFAREQPAGYKPFWDCSSTPLWFWYNQANAEIDNPNMEGVIGGKTKLDAYGQFITPDESEYAYGCMIKYKPSFTQPEELIMFDPRQIGGVPEHFFKNAGNPMIDTGDVNPNIQVLNQTNHIGYDRHFNAYGTSCMMLYSGQLNAVQDCEGDDKVLTASAITNSVISINNAPKFSFFAPVGNTSRINIKAQEVGNEIVSQPAQGFNNMENVYRNFLGTQIGASEISLSYDGTIQKRFAFKHLHTPERIGNNFNAGADAGDPIIDDANNEVYKINKRLGGESFCPDMVPYNTDITTLSKDDTQTDIKIAGFNQNITPWSAIYDAGSGIYFDAFGGTDTNKKYWEKCLWGLLGFSYAQFNFKYVNDKNTNYLARLNNNSRINPENQGQTPQIFTNSYVKSADLTLYDTNAYGAHMYSGSSAFAPIFLSAKDITAKDGKVIYPSSVNNPPITIDCDSVSLKADKQPTKMLRPYYLIKSNIVGDMKYIGAGHQNEGGQLLPIVGVVNKENGFGDYYFQSSVKNVFTITRDMTLTDITTSIHDPDMSFARVDNNCAVLYMVEKQNNNNLNIVSTLIQEKQLNPQALMPTQLTDAEYNGYFKSFILNKEEMGEEEMDFNMRMSDPIYGRDVMAQQGMDQRPSQIPAGLVPQGAPDNRTAMDILMQQSRPNIANRSEQSFATMDDYRQTRANETLRSNLGERYGAQAVPSYPSTRSGAVVRGEAPELPSVENHPSKASKPASSVNEPRL